MRQRVAYARQLVAQGHSPSVLAPVLQISRQGIYRIPTTPPAAGSAYGRRSAKSTRRSLRWLRPTRPTYRIVTAWVRRKLGRPVNRKRVLRVMRVRKLIQRRAHEPHRRRPEFFRVERPGEL